VTRQRSTTVSVVVPTYDRADAVRGCVQALGSLDYPTDAVEVVVIDDASPHPVELAGIEAPCSVRVLRVERNGGPAAARNLGAREATGDVVAFTDDDCRPEPAWLGALVGALDAEPDALAGGRTVNALEENPFAEASQDLVSYLYDAAPGGRSLLPFFTSNNFAVRRDRFHSLGGFDETFRFTAAEDRDLSERWAAEIGPLRFVPEARVRHHHDLSLRTFLRQHYVYGRGAVHLARRRLLRGRSRPWPEPPGFYLRMLAHAFRGRPLVEGVTLSGLVGLAQLSGATGVVVEKLRG